MKFLSAFGFLITMMVLAGCDSNQYAEKAKNYGPEQSEAVFARHMDAFMKNDITALMADYKDDAKLFTQDSVYLGKEQIQSFFEGAFEAFPTGTIETTLDAKSAVDNILFIVWRGSSSKVDVSYATDTFIIEDDKIATQTFAIVMSPKE